ncbi:hypothetical protein Pta02_02070 [Planobispora takensis]|uniref:Uncharacterized protein n=1 Tax=Planobispora takensis TaxID=1367882 RepID=A0A8J3SPF9_9ACTN|nr:hypothetical protein Pta02_02070 [Planobispora takensis]
MTGQYGDLPAVLARAALMDIATVSTFFVSLEPALLAPGVHPIPAGAVRLDVRYPPDIRPRENMMRMSTRVRT